MSNAEKMAKLVRNYDEKKKSKVYQKAVKFCNGRIARKVERFARKGKSSCLVKLPKRISVWEVTNYLQDRSYSIIQGINRITITW